MSLIEQLGGYERAKIIQGSREMGGLPADLDLEDALLEYRRQHNIFEEGDKIVFIDDFMHGELMTVAWTRKGEVWMDGGAKRCTDLSMIRHADDGELEAGKRLEVKSEN